MRNIKAHSNKLIKQIKGWVLFFCLVSNIFYAAEAIAATPSNDSITPSSGSTTPNTPRTFTSKYSDADGWPNINDACLLISQTPTPSTNSVYVRYNQNTGYLYLRNDANTAWLGECTVGSYNTIENSRVKLDCYQTTVSGSNNTLIVAFNLTFKESFSGKAYNTYLYVKDDNNNYAGWSQRGTYIVNRAPQTGTINPASGTSMVNMPQIFTTTYIDPDGWQNIQEAYLLMNTTSANTAACPYVYYNQNTNHLYLRNDANTAWIGECTVGSYCVIENSRAKLDCHATTVSGSGDTLTVNWSLTIKPPFTGEKNTYLYVKDDFNASAGFTQAGTYTIYPGTSINPAQGGEVVSPDGKVRLIIPPGAFGGGTKNILLLLKNPSDFGGAIPPDYKLLTMVECQPEGLVFWKPCRLIITLDKPEVPGTPIELGLLTGGVIDLSYEASHINSDGTTVEFLINHFSTYAGLSSMLSQGAPIGSGVKIPLPDLLTGAFGHSIPITVPPGRKGMQPNLTLQYRSSSSNSWVGMGWSMNPGYIVRSTKLGPPTYNDTNDTFIFVTDSGSTELVHLIDNLYQAKIESSFAKFFKEADDSWKVIQKDGTTLNFGQTTESKETSVAGTFLWNLTKVVDNNGNYVELTYTKELGEGKSYLSRVDYTGNDTTGTSPSNSVEFTLDDRTDISSNYIFGSEVKLAKRLKEIEVKQQGDLVWRYALTYEYSPYTKRSLLKTITQYSSDGTPMPTQTFKYQSAE